MTLFAEAIFYSNADRRWYGEDFLIEVTPNESYQASVRPEIIVSDTFRSNLGKLSASNLSTGIAFQAKDVEIIYFMEWQICAPNGSCKPFERRWYAYSNDAKIGCVRNSGVYRYCNFTSEAPSTLSLFVPGVGSPRGTWTLKLRALNIYGTYGVMTIAITI